MVHVIAAVVGADPDAIRLSPFNTIHDAEGVNLFCPLPYFSDIGSSLLQLKLAYLHIVVALEEGEMVDGLTEI